MSSEPGGESPRLHTVEVGTFLATNFPEPPPLLGRALREGSLAMVHGRAGAGKTFLMLGMAISAAYGIDFLGWHAPRPVPVLYIDGEMAAYDLQARLRALSHWVLETIDHVWQPLYVVTPGLQLGGIPKIDTVEGRAALLDAVKRNSVRLAFLDNLSCLTDPLDDNASSSWSAVQELIHQLRIVGVGEGFARVCEWLFGRYHRAAIAASGGAPVVSLARRALAGGTARAR